MVATLSGDTPRMPSRTEPCDNAAMGHETSQDLLAAIAKAGRRRRRLLAEVARVEHELGHCIADAKRLQPRLSDELLAVTAGITRESATRWRRRAETEGAAELVD